MAFSPEARGLVDLLAGDIEAREKAGVRVRKRRSTALASFKAALAGFLWDLLRASPGLPEAGLVYRSMHARSFDGGVVSYDAFRASVWGLHDLGLLEAFRGYRKDVIFDWGGGVTATVKGGFAARFRATPALVALAADHGIDPADLDGHFTPPPPRRTHRRLLSLKSQSTRSGPEKIAGKPIDF